MLLYVFYMFCICFVYVFNMFLYVLNMFAAPAEFDRPLYAERGQAARDLETSRLRDGPRRPGLLAPASGPSKEQRKNMKQTLKTRIKHI